MLQVKTEVKQSSISGLGLFAAEFICRDELIWGFNNEMDREFTLRQLQNLAPIFRDEILEYSWKSRQDIIIYPIDGAKYFNHSKNPNCFCEPNGRTFAARDIQPGEELTCNYEEFEEHQGEGIHSLRIDTL